ncbi:MAG TPA: RNase adapter RapZ [Pseudobacteroides sp.]|uniref:RNase adapter RapZ n=1 Tax=Pseudobacteroides sp. TaxID=1968840 RepID=UPI002F95CC6C
MRFVIVTGLSGAGKSQVVKHLEDLGFFCVDNLPPSLIPKFAEVCFQSRSKMDKIALVIDIRGGELFKDIFPGLSEIKAAGFNCEILFLEASDDVLIKRFKESRRNHPLAPEGRLNKAISEERKILQEIKKNANHIIDTSNLTTRQLKEEIARIFVEGKHFEGLIISIISFGFKYGMPMDCDLVFDVRFIPNPYYISSLKKLTGKHEDVKAYVLKSKETEVFINKLSDMLEFLIPNYIKEGKSQLVIGIGCTGGKHRSVAIADDIFRILVEKQHRVVIEHRDIEKDNKALAK